MGLYTELSKIQLPALQAGVAETIVTTDEALGLMAYQDVAPNIQIQWNKEASIYLGNSGSLIQPDGTFTPMSASYTQVTQDLTFVGASFNMPKALATDVSVATEVVKKSKAVARSMGDLLINGQVTGNCNFTGLRYTVSGSSTQDIAVAAAGSGSFSLGKLDEAISAVKAGRPNMILVSSAGMRYFKSAIRTTGTSATTLQLENYGTPFVSYDGIPVVVSDWIGLEQNGGTSVYVLYTNEVDGIRLWSNSNQLISVIGPVGVANSLSDNYTVGSAYGLVIPTPLAVSRVYGILQ